MTKLRVCNSDLRAIGSTFDATDFVKKIEVLGQWTINATVPNNDSICKYVARGAVYEVNGQYFDHKILKSSKIAGNTTSLTAWHVSTRLSNYSVPANYTCVGTVEEIISDILDIAVDSSGNKASSMFSVGVCANAGNQSYALGNTQDVSALTAINGLQSVGVEPRYDNFIVNAPERWGADRGKIFRYGYDLCGYEIEDDATQDTFTLTLNIANRQQSPDATEEDYFEIGDDAGVENVDTGSIISGNRIISYELHHDDHTQDKITIGQKIKTIIDTVRSQQVAINNSVQMGRAFNNNTVTRQNGFVSVTNGSDGNPAIRVEHSGTNGFIIQHSSDGGSTWQDIFTVDVIDGTVTITAADGKSKVVLGVNGGYSAYSINDNGDWNLVAGMDTNGDSIATKLYVPGYPAQYAIIGKNPDNGYIGLQMFDNGSCFAKIIETEGQGVTIIDGTQTTQVQISSDGVKSFKNGSEIGKSGTFHIPSGDGYAAYDVTVTDGQTANW